MRRLVALVAAIAMVGGAVFVRGRLDDRAEAGNALVRVTCASELEELCNAAAARDGPNASVTVEPAGETADRLARAQSARDAGLDAWVVPAPWPQIVEEARKRNALRPLLESSAVAARSPVVLVSWNDRRAVLERHCKQPVGWRCLGDAAPAGSWRDLGGQELWGLYKPFVPDPSREASGLIALGAATFAFHGRPDLAAIDLDEDSYLAWVGALARSMRSAIPLSGAAAVQEMLTKGPAAFDVVAVLEADAATSVVLSARSSELGLIYPSPMVTADAVVATRLDSASGERVRKFVVSDRGKKALAADGWRVEGQAPATGVGGGPPLPRESGLPSAGLLAAIRIKWQEATR